MADDAWRGENACQPSGPACVFGACSNASLCECFANFDQNRFFLRIDDCSLPTALFPVTFALALAVGLITIGLSVWSASRAPSRGRTRWLITVQCLAATSMVAGSIAAVAQNGTGRSFWVFMAAFHWFMFISYAHMIRVFIDSTRLAPVSLHARMEKDAVLVLHYGLMFCCPLPMTALALFTLALGDESSPTYDARMYNSAVALTFSLIPVVIIVFGTPLTLLSSSRMLAALDASRAIVSVSSNNNLSDVRRRIVLFRVAGGIVFPICTLLFMVIGFGLAYLERWPVVGYVAFFITLSAMAGPLALTAVLTSRTRLHSVKEESTTGPANASTTRNAPAPGSPAAARPQGQSDDYPASKWGRRMPVDGSTKGTFMSSFVTRAFSQASASVAENEPQ